MMKRYAFGPWLPDLNPVLNQDGLTVARNVVPVGGGYGPLKTLETVSGVGATDAFVRGAIGGIDFSGNPYSFAGDESKIYSSTNSGTTDFSREEGYLTTDDSRWEFAIFGDIVLATNYIDELQYFDLRTSSAFANVSSIPDIAPGVPRAKHMGVIDNFLVLGNIYESSIGVQPNSISWSTINNPLSWPTRGTDLAVASLSDQQELEGPGGNVVGVVPGSEVGAIFQEHAIWRMDFVGGDVVFALKRVEPNRGLLIPGLAVPIGRQIFYLSEDGFYMFDYNTSQPIGKDKVNQTFLSDIDADFFHRVSAIRDPDETRVYVLYPGSGHDDDGTPNKMLIYDFVLDQFSEAEVDAQWLCLSYTGQEAGSIADLDSPDTPADPDVLGDVGGVTILHTNDFQPFNIFEDIDNFYSATPEEQAEWVFTHEWVDWAVAWGLPIDPEVGI